MRVAIMQPYFMPYAGYFRLLASTDLFVIYDCVQFPRRGWVHRNRLHDTNGNLQWLTLPMEKGDRDSTRICDLAFAEGAQRRWDEEARRFPALQDLKRRPGELSQTIFQVEGSPLDYIVRSLRIAARLLKIQTPTMYSSTLEVPATIKGQERIIEIAKRVGATVYINAPGGRELYQDAEFVRAQIELRFLEDFHGSTTSILERLVLESPEDIAIEIEANLRFQRDLA